MQIRSGQSETIGQSGWPRFVGIVATYLLLGPLIGALLLFSGLVLLLGLEQPMTGRFMGDVQFLAASTVLWMPLAYITGLLPAAVIGVAVAIWERRKGVISLPIALAVSFFMWILLFSRTFDPFVPGDPSVYTTWLTPIACLGATGLCTWLVRLWNRKPPQNIT